MALSGHARIASEWLNPARGASFQPPRRAQALHASARAHIDRALVDHLYGHVPTATSANIVLAIVVSVGLWDPLAPFLLIGWLALIAGVSAIRLLDLSRFRRTQCHDAHRWRRRYVVLLVASGSLWGATIPLFGPLVPANREVLVIVAVAGLSAGALPVNGAIFSVYCTYLACVLLPGVATYLAAWSGPYFLFGVMGIVYGLVLVIAARQFSYNLRTAYELSARLEQANQELERRATHDQLTGLWNRSRFETALEQELERVDRYHAHCALIMIDLDHFKQVNDTFGHASGDALLKRVAATLAEEMRGSDCAARWGGEEFTVLLPETTRAGGGQVAERLRRRIGELDAEGAGYISASLGVATCQPGESVAALFERLDHALYRAKRGGRNCVVVASPGSPNHRVGIDSADPKLRLDDQSALLAPGYPGRQ